MAILRAIANHYDDLLNMPPRPKDGQRVIADAVTYDSERPEPSAARKSSTDV